jgi:hypothetical protein
MLKWPLLRLTGGTKFHNINHDDLFDKHSQYETYKVTLQLADVLVTGTPMQSIGFF